MDDFKKIEAQLEIPMISSETLQKITMDESMFLGNPLEITQKMTYFRGSLRKSHRKGGVDIKRNDPQTFLIDSDAELFM